MHFGASFVPLETSGVILVKHISLLKSDLGSIKISSDFDPPYHCSCEINDAEHISISFHN